MNSSGSRLVLINVILMLPTLLFLVANLLVEELKLEFASAFLAVWTRHRFLGWLCSPVAILGGPATVLLVSTLKVFRVSMERIHEEFVIALSIKRLFGHLACAAVAGSSILFVLACAFVENFQLVHR